MPEILRIIKRNYEILRSYGEIERDTEIFVNKEKIMEKGFNFKFFTSIDDTDEPYRYCFEKGFRVIGDYVYIKDDLTQAEITVKQESGKNQRPFPLI
ncbi:hypothetical protein ACHMWN_08825 [Pedobacter sp. UC225_61]|uniref:hypothetical protein n=1 Tax=Pedobacter sp. UC225_61 TaxID=3374623 RepID=UPI00378E0344